MNTKILALSAAQSFYWFATLVGISLSAIVGVELSPRPELATLPFALSSLGGLLSTYPLALYMQRQNRRAGLRLGAAIGATAALFCCLALQWASFWMFCIGSLMMGIYQASSAYYRLAALDEAPTDKQASAMSWVLGGSLLAAVAGPSVAQVARALPWGAAYTGPYLMVAAFSLTAFFTLGVLGQQSTTAPIKSKGQLKALARNRNYLLGLSNTAVAQLLMMLMMVIAPLAMHRQGYTVALSLSVIGWHIVGMFLPSLFSGKLIDRFGPRLAVWAGIAIYTGSAFVALAGDNPAHYYSSLFLLGVGWNFMYSAGTLLYNGSLPADIRAKGQGLAELAVALAGALAVLSGGILITLQSWAQINRITLVVLAIALLLNVVLGNSDKNR